ncbi:MAG: hypothetical protein BroJett021_05080 [Chloroflexota bacterium]|nr:MAG: hypothetical protein BroJett021_05080 [Chloroflexota bacterium]
MSRILIAGIVVFLALLALLVTVGVHEEQRLVTAAQIDRARQIEQGALLYEQHCRTCHGSNGEGLGALGPALHDAHFFTGRLREVGWAGSMHDYVATTIANGRITATRPLYVGDGEVAMPPWSRASGGPLRYDQIEALTAFVLNWQPTALGEVIVAPMPTPTPLAVSDAAQIARGRQLYGEAGCAACHGDNADGVANVGPALTGIGAGAGERVPGVSPEEYLRASVLIPAAHVAEGYARPGDCAAIMTDVQLTDLVAYLLTVE